MARFVDAVALCRAGKQPRKLKPPPPEPPAYFCGHCDLYVENSPKAIARHREVCARLFKRSLDG